MPVSSIPLSDHDLLSFLRLHLICRPTWHHRPHDPEPLLPQLFLNTSPPTSCYWLKFHQQSLDQSLGSNQPSTYSILLLSSWPRLEEDTGQTDRPHFKFKPTTLKQAIHVLWQSSLISRFHTLPFLCGCFMPLHPAHHSTPALLCFSSTLTFSCWCPHFTECLPPHPLAHFLPVSKDLRSKVLSTAHSQCALPHVPISECCWRPWFQQLPLFSLLPLLTSTLFPLARCCYLSQTQLHFFWISISLLSLQQDNLKEL